MSHDQFREDIEFLAGRLPHRGANTENERLAAEFLVDRLKEYTPDATLDDFYSIDSHANLFALYYFDFLFAAIFAIWWPWIGAGYGVAIFLMYMAEVTGYSVMGRLLPQYETQNVSARFLCPAPRQTLVIAANYDSPRATVLTRPEFAPKLRSIHFAILVAMIIVIATCVADGLGVLHGPGQLLIGHSLRWTAAAGLAGAAWVLYRSELLGEYTRGANNNASGAAVLLHVAERLKQDPLEITDIVLVATGSKETWLHGMQHFVRAMNLDLHRTAFINVTGVGAGELHYIKGEGLIRLYRCARPLIETAELLSQTHGVKGAVYRGLPTDALIPLTRGYYTLGIMGIGPQGLPLHWNQPTDTVPEIDFHTLARAAEYTEAIIRQLDRKPFR